MLALRASLWALVPAAVLGLGIELLQVRPLCNVGLLCPKLSRVAPKIGMQRLVEGGRESIAALIRCSALAAALACMLSDRLVELLFASSDVTEALTNAHTAAQVLLRVGAIALSIAALIDYWLRRRRFMSELSMSLDEVRREIKEDVGDPHVRSARRQLHQALSLEDVKAAVKRSKVIVVERASSAPHFGRGREDQ